jgi:Arc/MetJ-type ribon-helix-helix transcriptional regulator
MRNTTVMITVKLPQSLARRLDAGVRRKRTGRSAFVRAAIEAALRQQDGETRNGSVLSQCRDLVGCVDGPADLSHGARHMRGFGQRR